MEGLLSFTAHRRIQTWSAHLDSSLTKRFKFEGKRAELLRLKRFFGVRMFCITLFEMKKEIFRGKNRRSLQIFKRIIT